MTLMIRTDLDARFARARRAIGLGVTLLVVASCQSLDVTNPNSAAEPEVLSTAEGIQALAIGMQRSSAIGVQQTFIRDGGMSSKELVANSTFINQLILEQGGTSLTGSGPVGGALSGPMGILRMAENIVERAPDLPFDPGMRSGILALAYLHKAMAIGVMTTFFERAPVATNPDELAVFLSRDSALAVAIANLDNALAIIAATPPSTAFNTSVKGSRLDLINTIRAYRARYLLFRGDYADAITAANSVSISVASYFSYDATGSNPIFASLVQGNPTYAARDNLGYPLVEAGDARIAFFLTPNAATSLPSGIPIDRTAGFFTTATSPIPVYRPGEMALIRAEAHIRLGNLAAAVTEINTIRTKTAASDAVGIGANRPAYSGAVTTAALLEEVYRQRAAELYMSGLRLEDQRRLGRPAPPASMVERNRVYWPYPDQERNNNPNTPPNPPA